MALNWKFCHAAATGQLDVAIQAAQEGVDVRVYDYWAFRWACRGGHLAVAAWLADRGGGGDFNTTLQWACELGQFDIIVWMSTRFGLSRDNVCSDNNRALQLACAGGHLAVARWLAQTFGLEAADAKSRDNLALHLACANGHLDVVQWLFATFGLTPREDDVRVENYSEAVTKWLRETIRE
ncbi:MAG: ankyrin repeat domain-containing protein [Gemmatimonadaceae bacterium]